jgi:hypothetical protein
VGILSNGKTLGLLIIATLFTQPAVRNELPSWMGVPPEEAKNPTKTLVMGVIMFVWMFALMCHAMRNTYRKLRACYQDRRDKKQAARELLFKKQPPTMSRLTTKKGQAELSGPGVVMSVVPKSPKASPRPLLPHS